MALITSGWGCRKAGWTADTAFEHIPFGLVLGEDGGKLKVRSHPRPAANTC